MHTDTNKGQKYPDITVKLTKTDGNAFSILGKVGDALKKGGVDKSEVDRFYKEAMGGDYNHLLATCMRWVVVR
jgi:hypothetical protein